MSIEVDISNRIRAELAAGTFPRVSYDKTTKEAVQGDPETPSLVINVDAGTLNGSAAGASRRFSGARMENVTITAIASFRTEVDVTTFLATGLKFPITLRSEGALVTIAKGSFSTLEAPRQGAQNGTELILTLTANIRR